MLPCITQIDKSGAKTAEAQRIAPGLRGSGRCSEFLRSHGHRPRERKNEGMLPDQHHNVHSDGFSAATGKVTGKVAPFW
jgi:hypothetical protein